VELREYKIFGRAAYHSDHLAVHLIRLWFYPTMTPQNLLIRKILSFDHTSYAHWSATRTYLSAESSSRWKKIVLIAAYRQRKPLPSRPLVPAQRVNSDKTSLNFRRMSNYPVIRYRIVASYRYRRPKVDRSTMVKYVTSCGIFVDLGNRPLQNSRNYLETSFKVISEYSSIEHIRFCYSRPL